MIEDSSEVIEEKGFVKKAEHYFAVGEDLDDGEDEGISMVPDREEKLKPLNFKADRERAKGEKDSRAHLKSEGRFDPRPRI